MRVLLSIFSIILSSIAAVPSAEAQRLRLQFPPGEEFRAAIAALPQDQRSDVMSAANRVFPLFVFIPGIMGSQLTKNLPGGGTKVIWGKFDGVFARPDANLAFNETDDVSASVMEDYYIYNSPINVYGSALKAIKAMDLTMGGDNVKRFAYDWRQSNQKSARDFTKWICENQSQIRDRRLVILAHSMGGLVLKWWLKNFYDNEGCADGAKFASWIRIENIIFLGTPHFGAPKAITAFSDDYSVLVDPDDSAINRIFAAIDTVTMSKSLNTYGATFPSAYELLPIVSSNGCPRDASWPALVTFKPAASPAHDRIDLFNHETWRALNWPKNLPPNENRTQFVDSKLRQLLESAKAFQCELAGYRANSRFNVVRVVGVRRPTICKVTINESIGAAAARIDVERCQEGDGTVPKWIVAENGASPASQMRASGEGHMKLAGAQEFLDFLEDYREELHHRMQELSLQTAGNVEGLARMYASLQTVVPTSPASAADAAPAQTARRVAEILALQPADIFQAAAAATDPKARVTGYRIYAGLAPAQSVNRAWALNNAAHIYLQRQNFPAAVLLGKSAIGAAIDSKATGEIIPRAGSITATAAEQLNEASMAKTFRELSVGRIDVNSFTRSDL